jgi:site-specific recombinase XerD
MFLDWFTDNREQYQHCAHKHYIDHVGSKLVKLGYATEVIRQYLHEWLRFSLYLKKNGRTTLPTPGANIVGQYLAQRVTARSASRSRVLRASIRIFLEAKETGEFRLRIKAPHSTPAWFSSLLSQYLQFVRTHRGLAEKTVRKYSQKLSAFAQYLDGVGVTQIDLITPKLVQEFYGNAGQGVPRRSYGSTLRAFFRWAGAKGWLSNVLSDAVPRPRQYRFVTLPDVLHESEVDRILAAADRSTPLGRRDYAILLLAARYGLRPSDIRHLTLDQIDWRQAQINVRQIKTGRPLALPLLPEIAEALSAYLRDGRPASTYRAIFLRHRAPFKPFADENNLMAIMRTVLRRTGLANRAGRRGLYLFRHTLATRLLANGCPLKSIADVMGHASTETTYGYTRVDVVGLRAVAISEQEVTR